MLISLVRMKTVLRSTMKPSPEVKNPEEPQASRWTKFKLRHKKPKNMERGRFDLAWQLIWITPALFFVLLFTVFAIYIVFRDGFNGKSAADNFVWSLKNFRNIADDDSFTVALLNSFLYVLIAVPISMLLSLMVAKCLSNILNKKMFAFLQSLFFMPFVTSAIAVAMAFSMIFSSDSNSLFNQLMQALGLKNVDWSKPVNAKILLLIYGIWKMLPFQIIMFTAAFLAVDKRLYHAASVDGMGKTRQFWKISIPQIMPIIIYMLTTGIIGAFKFMPLGLFGSYVDAEASGVQTMVYYIFHAIKDVNNYGRGGAASIILMAIIMAMTIVNRLFVKLLKKRYR